MKRFLTLMLLLMTTELYAKELPTFNDVVSTLKAGHLITVVFSFPFSGNEQDSITAISQPNLLLIRSRYIKFAENHLTTNHPWYPNKTILENVNYKIENDDNMTVITRFLDPNTHKKLDRPDFILHSKLGDGTHIYAQNAE
jgi:hypothetical protein